MIMFFSAVIAGVLAIGLISYAIWRGRKTAKAMERIPAQNDWYK
jgi:hypothetical protein